MKFNELRRQVFRTDPFSVVDVFKWFPDVSPSALCNQLSQWTKRGELIRLRQNLYLLAEDRDAEEFFLANQIYQPSYVSLESALNYYGMIPDVPFAVTSVTVKKTQQFKNQFRYVPLTLGMLPVLSADLGSAAHTQGRVLFSYYSNLTVAPASSSRFLAASASCLLAFSITVLGAASTKSLASLSPRV